ncbi:MAG: hypothetical protein FH751_15845 [Firmicutes bacterium]|nr:hypothetical protein [Bacillota bacterium]
MKSKLILFLILLCILGYFIYSYPRKIHIESEGITYKLNDKEYKDRVYLKINGWLTDTPMPKGRGFLGTLTFFILSI